MRGVFAMIVLAGCGFDPNPPGATHNPDGPDGGGGGSDASTLSDAPIGFTCPSRYTTHELGHSYLMLKSLSWAAAKANCETDGGHLIKIESSAEDDKASQDLFFFAMDVWIGLQDLDNNGTYLWLDNTTPTFTHWASVPDAGSPDCVTKHIQQGGPWSARDCTETHDAVCECDLN